MARRQAADHESLIIDRGAAAEIPSEQAAREWAHGRRGFISSVMAELQSERKAAATAIRNIGAVPIMFETPHRRRGRDTLRSSVTRATIRFCSASGGTAIGSSLDNPL